MDNHNLRVYESVLGLLPSEENPTPMVCLNRVVPFKHAKVFAKLEWYNPFGAVKDRIADNLLRDAEQRGVLGDIKKLVEPTSGNTGLGLAMIANAKGYHLTTPLSEAIPLEKRTTLRFFGADVIELDDTLCPAPGAPEGAIARAMEISEQPDFHMLNQYENEANPDAHYRTTGPEVWKQTEGKVTHFVAGLGTCGTITGTGRFLKQKNPAVKVLGVHPEEGHDIPGVRSIRQLSQTKLYRPDEYDGTVEIKNEVAFRLCLRLNREESIIAGPSSGMALAGAFELVPDDKIPRVGYGKALYYTGDYEGALSILMPVAAERGQRLDEQTIDAIGHAGLALLMLGRGDEVPALVSVAVAAAPTRTDLRRLLAGALIGSGRGGEAVEVLNEGLRYNPRDGQLAIMLAYLLSTSPKDDVRAGEQAVRLAEQVAAATQHRDPEILRVLACAYAEVGRFREAVETTERAITVARQLGQESLVESLNAQLLEFEAGRPHRETPDQSFWGRARLRAHDTQRS